VKIHQVSASHIMCIQILMLMVKNAKISLSFPYCANPSLILILLTKNLTILLSLVMSCGFVWHCLYKQKCIQPMSFPLCLVLLIFIYLCLSAPGGWHHSFVLGATYFHLPALVCTLHHSFLLACTLIIVVNNSWELVQ